VNPIAMGDAAHAAGEAVFAELVEAASVRGSIGSRLPILREGFDRFTSAALDGSGVACKAGCANCCSQWVPGVRSFEIEAIALHVDSRSDRAKVVLGLAARIEARRSVADDAAYARLGIPCVFLDRGLCDIRPIRPFTCRAFFSFGPPERCAGHEASTGFMIEPHPAFDDLLDRVSGSAASGGQVTGSASGDLFTALHAALV
jgi:Fe-S-cluster containining protein